MRLRIVMAVAKPTSGSATSICGAAKERVEQHMVMHLVGRANMTEPSPDIVEKVARIRIRREGKDWDALDPALREVTLNSAKYDLAAALPIERQRWEQEVRERLEDRKTARMLRYAASSIEVQFPGFADALQELIVRLDSIFEQTKP